MNGMLRKDLLILRSNGKAYGGMVLLYAVIAVIGNTSLFSCMTAVLLLVLPINSFAADEQARWDQFAAALPGGRRAVVRGRYQFLLIVAAGTVLLSGVVALVTIALGRGGGLTPGELAMTALSCTAVGLLANALFFPFLFKYGTQKARICLAIGFGVIFAVLGIGATLVGDVAGVLSALPTAAFAGAAVVLLIAVLVGSYCISCRVYDRKEF